MKPRLVIRTGRTKPEWGAASGVFPQPGAAPSRTAGAWALTSSATAARALPCHLIAPSLHTFGAGTALFGLGRAPSPYGNGFVEVTGSIPVGSTTQRMGLADRTAKPFA